MKCRMGWTYSAGNDEGGLNASCSRGIAEVASQKYVRPWIKTVALAVAFTFLSQQVTYGQIARPAGVQPLVKGRIDLNQVSIPRDIAITKDINKTPSKELIINIKDVHDNYGAQESIVSVLDNLAVNYDVKFVGVEGSEGLIDMSIISSFPDDAAKKMTAESLMGQGKISAGEFFAALSSTPIKLYGIDDSKLYLENYNAFLNLLKEKGRNSRLIAYLRNALYALEDHVFSEELKQLNRNSILNNAQGEKFTKRWYFIEAIGEKHGLKCDMYPNINALVKAVEIEKKIDYAATNIQRDEVLEVLTRRLKKDQLEELILKSLSFKLGKISKNQFYSYVLLLAKAEGLDKNLYDELEVFCDYVALYESIDIAELMDEIEDYETRIKEKLYRNEDERKLTELLKDVEILNNIFAMSLTSGQLAYFKSHMDNFKWKTFLDFIKEDYRKYNLPLPAELAEAGELFKELPQAVAFYDAATARNHEMVENILRLMKENNVKVGAIVTGGFHTRGISEILKSDDLSYIILLPRFNPKTGERPYITILTNKTNEYKLYTESGEYLALTSNFAVMQEILEGSGMERSEFLTKAEAVAILLASSIAEYVRRGVINREVWNNVKDRYLRDYVARQTQMRDSGEISDRQAAESIALMEKLLTRSVIDRKEDGEIEVYFRSEDLTPEGNLQYVARFETRQEEGKEAEMVLAAIGRRTNVPGATIEGIEFEGAIKLAERVGERAVEEGARLLEGVGEMRRKALDDRVGSYLKTTQEQDIKKLTQGVENIAARLGMSGVVTEEMAREMVLSRIINKEFVGAGLTVEEATEERDGIIRLAQSRTGVTEELTSETVRNAAQEVATKQRLADRRAEAKKGVVAAFNELNIGLNSEELPEVYGEIEGELQTRLIAATTAEEVTNIIQETARELAGRKVRETIANEFTAIGFTEAVAQEEAASRQEEMLETVFLVSAAKGRETMSLSAIRMEAREEARVARIKVDVEEAKDAVRQQFKVLLGLKGIAEEPTEREINILLGDVAFMYEADKGKTITRDNIVNAVTLFADKLINARLDAREKQAKQSIKDAFSRYNIILTEEDIASYYDGIAEDLQEKIATESSTEVIYSIMRADAQAIADLRVQTTIRAGAIAAGVTLSKAQLEALQPEVIEAATFTATRLGRDGITFAEISSEAEDIALREKGEIEAGRARAERQRVRPAVAAAFADILNRAGISEIATAAEVDSLMDEVMPMLAAERQRTGVEPTSEDIAKVVALVVDTEGIVAQKKAAIGRRKIEATFTRLLQEEGILEAPGMETLVREVLQGLGITARARTVSEAEIESQVAMTVRRIVNEKKQQRLTAVESIVRDVFARFGLTATEDQIGVATERAVSALEARKQREVTPQMQAEILAFVQARLNNTITGVIRDAFREEGLTLTEEEIAIRRRELLGPAAGRRISVADIRDLAVEAARETAEAQRREAEAQRREVEIARTRDRVRQEHESLLAKAGIAETPTEAEIDEVLDGVLVMYGGDQAAVRVTAEQIRKGVEVFTKERIVEKQLAAVRRERRDIRGEVEGIISDIFAESNIELTQEELGRAYSSVISGLEQELAEGRIEEVEAQLQEVARQHISAVRKRMIFSAFEEAGISTMVASESEIGIIISDAALLALLAFLNGERENDMVTTNDIRLAAGTRISDILRKTMEEAINRVFSQRRFRITTEREAETFQSVLANARAMANEGLREGEKEKLPNLADISIAAEQMATREKAAIRDAVLEELKDIGIDEVFIARELEQILETSFSTEHALAQLNIVVRTIKKTIAMEMASLTAGGEWLGLTAEEVEGIVQYAQGMLLSGAVESRVEALRTATRVFVRDIISNATGMSNAMIERWSTDLVADVVRAAGARAALRGDKTFSIADVEVASIFIQSEKRAPVTREWEAMNKFIDGREDLTPQAAAKEWIRIAANIKEELKKQDIAIRPTALDVEQLSGAEESLEEAVEKWVQEKKEGAKKAVNDILASEQYEIDEAKKEILIEQAVKILTNSVLPYEENAEKVVEMLYKIQTQKAVNFTQYGVEMHVVGKQVDATGKEITGRERLERMYKDLGGKDPKGPGDGMVIEVTDESGNTTKIALVAEEALAGANFFDVVRHEVVHATTDASYVMAARFGGGFAPVAEEELSAWSEQMELGWIPQGDIEVIEKPINIEDLVGQLIEAKAKEEARKEEARLLAEKEAKERESRITGGTSDLIEEAKKVRDELMKLAAGLALAKTPEEEADIKAALQEKLLELEIAIARARQRLSSNRDVLEAATYTDPATNQTQTYYDKYDKDIAASLENTFRDAQDVLAGKTPLAGFQRAAIDARIEALRNRGAVDDLIVFVRSGDSYVRRSASSALGNLLSAESRLSRDFNMLLQGVPFEVQGVYIKINDELLSARIELAGLRRKQTSLLAEKPTATRTEEDIRQDREANKAEIENAEKRIQTLSSDRKIMDALLESALLEETSSAIFKNAAAVRVAVTQDGLGKRETFTNQILSELEGMWELGDKGGKPVALAQQSERTMQLVSALEIINGMNEEDDRSLFRLRQNDNLWDKSARKFKFDALTRLAEGINKVNGLLTRTMDMARNNVESRTRDIRSQTPWRSVVFGEGENTAVIPVLIKEKRDEAGELVYVKLTREEVDAGMKDLDNAATPFKKAMRQLAGLLEGKTERVRGLLKGLWRRRERAVFLATLSKQLGEWFETLNSVELPSALSDEFTQAEKDAYQEELKEFQALRDQIDKIFLKPQLSVKDILDLAGTKGREGLLEQATGVLISSNWLSSYNAVPLHDSISANIFNLTEFINPPPIAEGVVEKTLLEKLDSREQMTERFIGVLDVVEKGLVARGIDKRDAINEAKGIVDEMLDAIRVWKESVKIGEDIDRNGRLQELSAQLREVLMTLAFGESTEQLKALLESKLAGREINQDVMNDVLNGLGITDPLVAKQWSDHVLEKPDRKTRIESLAEYILRSLTVGYQGRDLESNVGRYFGGIAGEFTDSEGVVRNATVATFFQDLRPGMEIGRIVQREMRGSDGKGRTSKDDCLEKKLSKDFENKSLRMELAAYYQMATILAWGASPFVEQVEAGFDMADDWFVDISTGAGKTLAYPIPNIMNTIQGLNSIHNVTDDYYTERDFRETQFIYQMLGYSVTYMRGDEKDLKTAVGRLTNNDVVYMSYGALSFTCLDAKKDLTLPESKEWLRLLARTRLTFDECDVAPYLSDFIIAAQQSNLSVEEYVQKLMTLMTAEKLFEEGEISQVFSMMEDNVATVNARAANLDEQLTKVREMIAEEGVSVRIDKGNLVIADETVTEEEARAKRRIKVKEKEFLVSYDAKQGFVITRLEWIGEDVDAAGTVKLDLTATVAAADKRTEAVVARIMQQMAAKLNVFFPEMRIEAPSWEEFLDCVKALYIDKLGVKYRLQYAKETGAEAIIIDENGRVTQRGKPFTGFDVRMQESDSFLIMSDGEEVALLNNEYIDTHPSTQEAVISVGDKRYMVAKGTAGFLLTEASPQIVLLGEETMREQPGQRKDRFHTYYEMKHQKAEGEVPSVLGDNQSTEYLSFTDVTNLVHSYGGASGSVATAATVMNTIFPKAKGVKRMDPANPKKGAERPSVFVASDERTWNVALNKIREIYSNAPDASMIIYFDDVAQATKFQARLDAMLEELEGLAGGTINVNVFEEEGMQENILVERAGRPRTITLSDAKLGRATNVVLSESVGFRPDNSKKQLRELLRRSREAGVNPLAGYFEFYNELDIMEKLQEENNLAEWLQKEFPRRTREELTALAAEFLTNRGVAEASVDNYINNNIDDFFVMTLEKHFAGENGIFFESDYSRRYRKKQNIESFLRRMGAGSASEISQIVGQKYFEGLYLVDLSVDRSDQGKVQKFGRNRRQGDVGYVDSFYSIERGSKFYRMVEELYQPRFTAGLRRKEIEEGKAKFMEFQENSRLLALMEGAVLTKEGNFRNYNELDQDVLRELFERREFREAYITEMEGARGDLENELDAFINETADAAVNKKINDYAFGKWCSLQDYFTNLLREVRTKSQERRDKARIKRAKRDATTQKELEKARQLPVAENEKIDRDINYARKVIEQRVDYILDRYFEGLGEGKLVGEALIRRLEECLGVIEEHFHVDLGEGKKEAFQAALRRADARELAALRQRLRDNILRVLNSLGSVVIALGEETPLETGNMAYNLTIDVDNVLQVRGITYHMPDGTEEEERAVVVKADGSEIMIGANKYAVEYAEDGSLTLTDEAGGTTKFIREGFREGKDIVTLEGGFQSAVKAISKEGIDRLKQKIIKEAREDPSGKGRVVNTDTSAQGLLDAAVEESRKRFLARDRELDDYRRRSGRERITKAEEVMSRELESLPYMLEEERLKAGEEREKLIAEGKLRAETIKEKKTTRRMARQADETLREDVERERAEVLEEAAPEEVVAVARDTSRDRYSVSQNFASLLGEDLSFETRESGTANQADKAVAEEAKETKRETETKEAASRTLREDQMTRERAPGSSNAFVAIAETESEKTLSDAERAQAFGIPPIPGEPQDNPPRIIVVAPAAVFSNLSDDERERLADQLYAQHEGSVKEGETLYVSIDGRSEGVVDEDGNAVYRFSGVKVFDPTSARVLVDEKVRAENAVGRRGEALSQKALADALNLSPEEGARVYIRKIGKSNLLVAIDNDGTTYVRSLGENVYAHTRQEVLRANRILLGKDAEANKTKKKGDEFRVDVNGVFMATAGSAEKAEVDLNDVIAKNETGAEIPVERLALTKEAGRPVMPGFWRSVGRFFRDTIWGNIKEQAIAIGQGQVERMEQIEYSFDLAWRAGVGWRSLFLGVRWVLNKITIGFVAYLIKDMRIDFLMWRQKSKGSYDRAKERAVQEWKRSPWFQSWKHSLDSVPQERKAVKTLARVTGWFLDQFAINISQAQWTSFPYAVSNIITRLVQIGYYLMWWLPTRSLWFVFYGGWAKLFGWLQKKFAKEKEPEPVLEEVVEARVSEKIREGTLTTDEAVKIAEELTGESITSEQREALNDFISSGTYISPSRIELAHPDRVVQVALLFTYAAKSPDNSEPRYKGTYTKIAQMLFDEAEEAEKAGRKDKAEKLRLNAYNYLMVATVADKDDMAAKALLGTIQYSMDDKEEAKKLLTEVDKRGVPDDEGAEYMARAILGKIQQDDNEHREAARTYSKIPSARAPAVTVLGEEIEISQKKAEALKAFKAAKAPKEEEKKTTIREKMGGAIGTGWGKMMKNRRNMLIGGAVVFVALVLLAIFFPVVLPYIGWVASYTLGWLPGLGWVGATIGSFSIGGLSLSWGSVGAIMKLFSLQAWYTIS